VSNNPFTPAEDQIIKQSRGNLTNRQIAEKLGRSLDSVKKRIRILKLKKEKNSPAFPKEMVDKIIALHGNGMTSDQIAAIVGKSPQGVRNKLRLLGLGRQKLASRPPQPKPKPIYKGKTKPVYKIPEPKGERYMPDTLAAVMALTTEQCRWPVGHPGKAGFRFCRRDRDGKLPYCEKHYKRAYRLPQPPEGVTPCPSP
jgi:GcrA cell cycle regulator